MTNLAGAIKEKKKFGVTVFLFFVRAKDWFYCSLSLCPFKPSDVAVFFPTVCRWHAKQLLRQHRCAHTVVPFSNRKWVT